MSNGKNDAMIQSNIDRILFFAELAIKYYTTEINHFRQLGIQMVIWANQMLRGTVSHLEYLAHSIYSQESVVSIEPTIASLSSIFTYQNVSELEEAEKKYLG